MLYQSILRLYRAGKLDENALDAAIAKGWITEGQKVKILEG